MDHDEIVVFVVDEYWKQIDKRGPAQWSGALRQGQDIPLIHEGRITLFRVLGVRPGEGQGRFVQVTEVVLRCPFCDGRLRDENGHAGLEQDEKGAFLACRHCRERVAMEQVPTPPGGPVEFHVAPGQGKGSGPFFA